MNTRVSITVNGRLHLGHAYMILLNEQVAHNSGGMFHFRFDDDQAWWNKQLGKERVAELRKAMREDVEWLEIPVDSWSSEAEVARRAGGLWDRLIPQPESGRVWNCVTDTFLCPEVPPDPPGAWYPFVPHLTIPKVIFDGLQEITHVIRGRELITEFALYEYLWYLIWGGERKPVQVFLPRLRLADGAELADISKTRGNYKLADLRAKGFAAEEVRLLLAAVCLKDIAASWEVENVKEEPVIGADQDA